MKKILFLLFSLSLTGHLLSQITVPYLYHSNTSNWGGSGISGTYRSSLGVKSHLFGFTAGSTISNFYKVHNYQENFDNNFNTGGSFPKVWSGGLSLETLGTAFAYGDGQGGAASFPITSGKYYTFIWEDVNTATNARAIVMETNSAPVSITAVNFSPTQPSNTEPVTVTVDLSAIPSSQEKVYVRYSTNYFSSGYGTLLNPTSGNGTNVQTFTIPAQPNNTVVTFYVFTTTLSSSSLNNNSILTDLATITFDNNGGSNFNIISLPIELKLFEVHLIDKSVFLNWQTATETRNSHFEIEHSRDAQTWKALAEVPGHGNSLVPQSYKWTHERATSGVNFYRLRQVDWDGSFAYSPVVKANVGRAQQVTVAPNPLTGNVLQVKLDTENEDEAHLQLLNSLGQPVRDLYALATTGQWLSLDVTDLPAGIYWLVVDNGTPVKVVR